MQDTMRQMTPELPGNHGQFGENVATENYERLRATQKVKVRPVVPGGQTPETRPDGTAEEAEGHPS